MSGTLDKPPPLEGRDTICDSINNASDINSDIFKPRIELDRSPKPETFGSEQTKPTELSLSDSDDSCIILDDVCKPQHLLLEPKAAPSQDTSLYRHKKELIYAAYGRSQSRQQEHNDANKHVVDSRIKTPNLSESSDSYSSSSSCETSQDEGQDVEMLNPPPPPCDMVDQSSSDEFCSLPPTLEPAVPGLTKTNAADGDLFQGSRGPKDARTQKVECASQTVESLFSNIPSSSEVPGPKARLAPPPILHGINPAPPPSNRGRPRKNPPMLKPQVATNESSEIDLSDDNKTRKTAKKFRKKKDKLSVLFNVAKLQKKDGKDKVQPRDEPSPERTIRTADVSDSDHYTEENAGKRTKTGKKKCRERRREKHTKSKLQKTHKHKNVHHTKLFHEKRKTKKMKRKTDEDKRSNLDMADTEKIKRHKEKRERKKTRKDSNFEYPDVTGRLKRPSSKDGRTSTPSQEELKKRPSSRVDMKKVVPAEGSRGSSQEKMSSLKSYRKGETDEADDKSKPVVESQPFSQEMETLEHTIELEDNFLSIFTQKPDDIIKHHFVPSDPAAVLVFPRKFCNLKPDRFWKKSRRKAPVEKPETEPVAPLAAPSNSAPTKDLVGSVFATKASVKVYKFISQTRFTFDKSFVNKLLFFSSCPCACSSASHFFPYFVCLLKYYNFRSCLVPS